MYIGDRETRGRGNRSVELGVEKIGKKDLEVIFMREKN